MKTYTNPTHARPSRAAGFTLLEVVIALALSLLLLAALLPTMISGLVLGMKSVASSQSSNSVRLAMEHMASEISKSVDTPRLDPPSASASTPRSRVIYTTSVGMPGRAAANLTSRSSNTLKVWLDGSCHPKAGDRVQISGLKMDNGLLVTNVGNDTRSASEGTLYQEAIVDITFETSIENATIGAKNDVSGGQGVSFRRESAYEVVTVGNGSAQEKQLRWFKQASDSQPTAVVATGLSPTASAPFSVDNQGALVINLLGDASRDAPNEQMVGGNRRAYTLAGFRSQLGSKTGKRFDANGGGGGGSESTGTMSNSSISGTLGNLTEPTAGESTDPTGTTTPGNSSPATNPYNTNTPSAYSFEPTGGSPGSNPISTPSTFEKESNPANGLGSPPSKGTVKEGASPATESNNPALPAKYIPETKAGGPGSTKDPKSGSETPAKGGTKNDPAIDF